MLLSVACMIAWICMPRSPVHSASRENLECEQLIVESGKDAKIRDLPPSALSPAAPPILSGTNFCSVIETRLVAVRIASNIINCCLEWWRVFQSHQILISSLDIQNIVDQYSWSSRCHWLKLQLDILLILAREMKYTI